MFTYRTSKVPFTEDPVYTRRYNGYKLFYDDGSVEQYSLFIYPTDRFIEVCLEHDIELDYNLEFISEEMIHRKFTCPYTDLKVVSQTQVTLGVDLPYDNDTLMYLKLAL